MTGYGAPRGDEIPRRELIRSKTIRCPKDDIGGPPLSSAPSTQHPGAMDRREQTPPNPYRACQEALVSKIQSGDLDIGRFYSVETTDAGLTAIDFPAGIMTKRSQNAPRRPKFSSFLSCSKTPPLLKEHGLSSAHPELAGPAVSMRGKPFVRCWGTRTSVSTASIQLPASHASSRLMPVRSSMTTTAALKGRSGRAREAEIGPRRGTASGDGTVPSVT